MSLSGSDTKAPRLPALRRGDVAPADVRVFDDIATTRGGMPISFRVFLNSPRAAEAIATFGKHVRWGSVLGSRLLEIVCLRVAAHEDDRFMWVHHAVLAREAGLTEGEIEVLQHGVSSPTVDDETRQIVAFIDAELDGTMSDALFAAVHERLGLAATMEIALAIAYYAMLHTLFATLRIDSATDTRVPLEQERGDGKEQR